MSLSNENNPQMVEGQIGAVSAGSAETRPMHTAKGKDRIKSATLLNGAALAGDDVNNVVVELRKRGTAVILASYTNDVASGGLVANDGKPMTLNADPTLLELADGDDVEVVISHNGTGQALTDAKVQMEIVA